VELEGQASLLADEAVAQVERHADPVVVSQWVSLVWDLARKNEEFSTNLVVMAACSIRLPTLVEPRALGTVMRQARGLGIIRPTDRFEPDITPGAHARPKRIWRSLICRT
jgi:hypothetical protein